MKTCVEPDCNHPVFSKGFCQVHWKYYFGKPIARRSKKRTKQEKQYSVDRKDFIEEQRDENGNIFCIFCGWVILRNPSLHHALGRDEELILETKYWMLGHNNCHVHEYHAKSWEDIPWWNEYLQRLKTYSIEVLEKELRRMDRL